MEILDKWVFIRKTYVLLTLRGFLKAGLLFSLNDYVERVGQYIFYCLLSKYVAKKGLNKVLC